MSECRPIPVHMDLVDRLLMANPKAHADLVSRIIRGAVPMPWAMVLVIGGQYHARVYFEEPLLEGSASIDEIQLPLGILAERPW